MKNKIIKIGINKKFKIKILDKQKIIIIFIKINPDKLIFIIYYYL